ncbi:MAG TPA: glycosyltransferase family 2 protein [Anaerolineales bacterium]|nr:glycosyltransferase family 2 protein [Anaerolineales bacterium]
MADFDIVIVNWNAGNKLFECLDSIRGSNVDSSFCLVKCIIVDNASRDGSLENIKDMGLPIELIVNTENKGFGFASNQGAKNGHSQYILFLNPDVRLFPDSLSKSVSFMESPDNKQIGVLGIQMVDENGTVHHNVARFPSPKSLFYQMFGLDRLWPKRFPPHFMTDWNYTESRVIDQVPGAFFLVRRSLFKDLNGFDERFFMYFEDLDFAYRARMGGWVNYYLSNVKAFHHGGGTTNQVRALRLFYMLRSRVYYVAKHFGFYHALWIVIASLVIEIWVRLGWSLINWSGRNFLETLQAYFLYIKELPALMKKIKE